MLTDAERSPTETIRRSPLRAYGVPILVGLLILAGGVIPWMALARINASVRPDLPWAALVSVAYIGILLAWLHGLGPPARTADDRRQRLRFLPRSAPDSDGISVGVVVLLLGILYIAWTAISLLSPIPDLGAYPTTSYRWSMFIMGGVTAGVLEEAAFRGYMQSGIERYDPDNAIWITSLVFVAAHINHGVGTLLVMAPGLFIVAMLYGTLARRTGTILPGMIIHVLGDLSRVYFGVLRGDGSLLFVN